MTTAISEPKKEISYKISKEEEEKFRKRLDLVLFGFSHNFPFWAVLSERCRYSLTKSPFCPTACVDKTGHIFFNYDFVETLTNEQFLLIVAHEICHFVFEHCLRIGDRDPMLWNIAVDYVSNLLLYYQFNNMKFFLNGIVFDDSWKSSNVEEHKFGGMVAETVYEELKKDPDNPWCKNLAMRDIMVSIAEEMLNNGEFTDIRDRRIPLPKNDGSGDKHSQEMRDYVRRALTEAFTLAKSQGTLPSNFERAIQKLLKPKVDWVTALRQKVRMGVTSLSKRDYTFSRPSRKFPDEDFIYPGMVGPDSPKIGYAIDTSGSMSEKDLTLALSELESIRKQFSAKVYFVDCDADVHSSRWLNPFEPLPRLRGGGGTDFYPVFEHLKAKKIKLDYCVFFTDGYGNFGPNDQKNYDVLWVMTSDVKPPFGDVIRYNTMQE